GGLRTQADRAEADALLALSSSSGSLPGAHQVRHHRMAISHLEGLHFLLAGPIGLGHALMLAQVFEPILGDEGLDVASWVGRVGEMLPEECPITATHLTEPLQGLGELGASSRIHPVFHREITGPLSPGISPAITGGGQCCEGVRSRFSWASRQRSVSTLAPASPVAARTSVHGIPMRSAIVPQARLPMPIAPLNTI